MLLDPGQDAATFSAYHAGFPLQLRERLQALGFGPAKSRILDLGCGQGDLAKMFAQAGCSVTALDISAAQLDLARENCAGLDVTFVQAPAEPKRAGQCQLRRRDRRSTAGIGWTAVGSPPKWRG